MNRKMCPSCKREVIVFEPRDIEGGFFYKHKSANDVECWWSLRSYPRPTQPAPDAGKSAVSKSIIRATAKSKSQAVTKRAQRG